MKTTVKTSLAAALAAIVLGAAPVSFGAEPISDGVQKESAAGVSAEKEKKPRARREAAKRNLAIVIDRSAGMDSKRFEKLKEKAKECVASLTPEEVVSLVVFGGQVEVLAPARIAHEEVKKDLIAKIDSIKKDKSAAAFAGIAKGAEEIRKNTDKKLANRIEIFSSSKTDDIVGPSDADTFERLQESLKKEKIHVKGLVRRNPRAERGNARGGRGEGRRPGRRPSGRKAPEKKAG